MIQSTFLMMTYWTILEITIILEFPLIFLVPDMTINYLSLNKAFSQMIYLQKRKLIMTIMVLLKFLKLRLVISMISSKMDCGNSLVVSSSHWKEYMRIFTQALG